MLGLGVTLLVAAGNLLGVFIPWERMSIDLRFTRAPRPSEPMTDRIVHVDIDDGALDRIGRWPWDRSLLADVIDELHQAGASTIAIDILLPDEQPLDFRPDQAEPVDHDARFAEALSQATCVLGIDIWNVSPFDELWSTPDGEAELNRLLSQLAQDVQQDELAALDLARVTGIRRSRVAKRPLEFKRAAVWNSRPALDEDLVAFNDFERQFTPQRSKYLGAYPEQPVLKSVWTQYAAFRSLQSHLLAGDHQGTFRDRAPLPAFCREASGIGFVTVARQKHSDGSVRELSVTLPTEGGISLQFGIAAAARYLNLEPSDIVIDDDTLWIGPTPLPLNDRKLWITWPTSTTSPLWEGLLCQDPDDPPFTGHLSIREIVEMARARITHQHNQDQLAILTARILEFAQISYTPGEELSGDTLQAVEDEISFTLEDAPEDTTVTETMDDEQAAYLDYVADCRAWREIHLAVQADQGKIELAKSLLSKQVNGKLVFVGWTATSSIADFVSTPIGAQTPGVLVHSSLANMVLTGRAVHFLPKWADLMLTLLLGLLGSLAAASGSTLRSMLTAILSFGAYLGIGGVWLFSALDLIVPMIAPLFAGISAWIACTALQAAIAQRDRMRITRQFRARVSAQLVDHLVDNPAALSVSGEEREMSVIFGDLAGFTTISEKLGGPATVSTLNHYLRELTHVLVDHGAYLNKFLGDGFMAFWSAFSPDSEQATKACLAALHCQEAITRLNKESSQKLDIPPIGLRLGIATDKVIVGDCGAPPDLNDYTVIGDAVNLAARLESANKQFGTRILINESTRIQLTDQSVLLRPLGRMTVVGQSTPVEIHEVLPSDTPSEMISLTERALKAFQESRFSEARKAFDELDQKYNTHKFSALYRQEMIEADEDFTGIIHLQEK